MEQIKGISLRKIDEEEIIKKVQSGLTLTFNILQDRNFSDGVAYVNSIVKFLTKVGINYRVFDVNNHDEFNEFHSLVLENKKTDTFIIAKPMNKDIITKLEKIINSESDPDMFTTYNKGKLYEGDLSKLPATAGAVIRLLDFYKFNITGKKVLVIGRSENVGLPIALGLMRKNGMVQIAHSKVDNGLLNKETESSDVIVLASGQKGLIKKESIHDNQIIIDCGFHAETKDGDLGFIPDESIKGYYTPVPGGIGPLTISTLVMNAYKLKGF